MSKTRAHVDAFLGAVAVLTLFALWYISQFWPNIWLAVCEPR